MPLTVAIYIVLCYHATVRILFLWTIDHRLSCDEKKPTVTSKHGNLNHEKKHNAKKHPASKETCTGKSGKKEHEDVKRKIPEGKKHAWEKKHAGGK
jgi:predicted Holliday junction resolvase-like endonuclease